MLLLLTGTMRMVLFMISQIEKREFGFLFPSVSIEKSKKAVMARHKSFSSEKEVWNFIDETNPLDCFLSTAYYRKPSARKMEEKGWLGADLFFDLDNDKKSLFDVKAEAQIIKHVLREDFGISDSQIIFSGAKGYHVVSTINDTKVLGIGSMERREIIDYLKNKYRCRFIDSPASCDIHRLRRLPGTINSKSGKMCEII